MEKMTLNQARGLAFDLAGTMHGYAYIDDHGCAPRADAVIGILEFNDGECVNVMLHKEAEYFCLNEVRFEGNQVHLTKRSVGGVVYVSRYGDLMNAVRAYNIQHRKNKGWSKETLYIVGRDGNGWATRAPGADEDDFNF